MKGFNDDELHNFVLLGKHIPVDIRFIEWMPFRSVFSCEPMSRPVAHRSVHLMCNLPLSWCLLLLFAAAINGTNDS